MRYEILNRFREDLENNTFQKMLLDNYKLDFTKNFYYKVNKNGELDEITENSSKEEILWVKERDIFSGYFSYNKKISKDNDSIMSNNYLTLIVKVGRLRNSVSIERYYDDILNIYSKNELFKIRPFDIEHFNTVKYIMDAAYSKVLNIYSEDLLKSKEKDLSKQEFAKLLESKVKIFYDEEMLLYKREINKYFMIKCFLNNDYCVKKGNITYGIPYVNQNANSKKPFLFNLTMPESSNFMLSLKEAIWLHYIYTYMNTTDYKTYISTSCNLEKDILGSVSIEGRTNILIKTEPTSTGSLIKEYSIMDEYRDTFTVYNIMNIKKASNESQVEEDINSYDMSFYQLHSYFADFFKNKEEKMMEYNFRIIRSLLVSNGQNQFKLVYKKFMNSVLEYLYLDTTNLSYKVSKFLNIRYSLDYYFKEGVNLSIAELRNNLYEKVVNGTDLETDEEFLFLYGQLYRYVINHTEAKDVNFDFCQLPLRIKKEKALKKELQNKVYKYSYALNLKNRKLTNALSMVYDYSMKEKLTLDNNTKLHTGLYYDNLFYIKNNNNNIDKDAEE